MADTYPVFINVRRADGGTDQVRVGSATRTNEGFVLQFGDLVIGANPVADAAPRTSSYGSSSYGASSPPPARSSGGAPTNFPPYGRSKSAPIAGASAEDLQYYAAGSRRSLADPSKARFHDKEREMLAAIEAEMQRQGLATGGDTRAAPRPRPSFMDAPPPSNARGGGDEPPPPGDDDIPF